MRQKIALSLIFLVGLTAVSSARINKYEMMEAMQPRVAHLKLKPEEFRALIDKEVIVRPVSSDNSKEMAAFGAVLAEATPDAFLESYSSLEIFQQNPSFIASGRFSSAPTLTDLDSLNIDDKDIYSLSRSRVGGGDIKLTEQEMARMRSTLGEAKRLTPQVKSKLSLEYKKILVERAKAYLSSGADSLGVFVDKDKPVNAQEAFASLLREQATTVGHCDHLYSYLEKYPQAAAPDSESFVYWAVQKFGDLKPVINLVHVLIHRDGSRIFIASKQIYSSHYTEAGLSVAELIPITDVQGQSRTVIAYTIRLQVDMLGGTLGFMKKRMAQPRFLGGLKMSLSGLRTNMEVLSRVSAQSR